MFLCCVGSVILFAIEAKSTDSVYTDLGIPQALSGIYFDMAMHSLFKLLQR